MVLDEADPESVSAGSFFVNPVVDEPSLARIVAAAGARPVPRHGAGEGKWKVPAAWLIEQSGFARGFTMGRVRVSRKHTLALVNEGGTTHDLLALARTVAEGVRERFGVTLTPEPVMLGCEM
jgi:UDP-N-acetylmuramate dehydrogenase